MNRVAANLPARLSSSSVVRSRPRCSAYSTVICVSQPLEKLSVESPGMPLKEAKLLIAHRAWYRWH
jgi:hypothetical protein